MNILYVAPAHPQGLEKDCVEALRELGHQAHAYDYRARHRQRGFAERVWDKCQPGFSLQKLNRDFLDFVLGLKPDFILVWKAELLFPETWLQIKKKTHARLAIWHHDNPYSVLSSTAHMLFSTSLYDHVFIFDPYFIPEVERLNARAVTYMPPFSSPRFFKTPVLTAGEEKKYAANVTFIGDAGGFRANRRHFLTTITDLGLKIWGRNWSPEPYQSLGLNLAYWGDEFNEAFNQCHGGFVQGDDMLKAYRGAKIAINVLPTQVVQGINLRAFEIPPSGTLMLSEYSDMVAREFNIDEEIVTYRDANELREKVLYYLNHDQERQAIATRGAERCRRDHTAAIRMRQILEIMFP